MVNIEAIETDVYLEGEAEFFDGLTLIEAEII